MHFYSDLFIFFLFTSICTIFSKSTPNTWINLRGDEIRSAAVRIPRAAEEEPERLTANYTIRFVPLISVIANYLPRFLNRLKTQEITKARSLNWLLSDEEICTTQHLGRFPNPDNQCQFFECAMNLKNLANCSNIDRNGENNLEQNYVKPIEDVIQLRSTIELSDKGKATSVAIMYKVDECVSLILHQCSPNHIYSNRLQRCLPYKNPRCPD